MKVLSFIHVEIFERDLTSENSNIAYRKFT